MKEPTRDLASVGFEMALVSVFLIILLAVAVIVFKIPIKMGVDNTRAVVNNASLNYYDDYNSKVVSGATVKAVVGSFHSNTDVTLLVQNINGYAVVYNKDLFATVTSPNGFVYLGGIAFTPSTKTFNIDISNQTVELYNGGLRIKKYGTGTVGAYLTNSVSSVPEAYIKSTSEYYSVLLYDSNNNITGIMFVLL